jgi:outer membrane protein TolC
VLNAENERFNATGAYIAGRAAVTVDELRLLASAGRLLDTLGVSATQQQQAQTVK